jgi:hypothetical protein
MRRALKRASASRPSGGWNDDDYDVLADGDVIGRIFHAAAAPVGPPRMWTLLVDYHQDRSQHTTTRRRARRQWQHSLRVGGGNEKAFTLACGAALVALL